jgi:hypothetical protein
MSPSTSERCLTRGRGQRELIIGDRQVNHLHRRCESEPDRCAVCLRGRWAEDFNWAEMISELARTKDMSSVVIVLSGADEASTLQFLRRSGARIGAVRSIVSWIPPICRPAALPFVGPILVGSLRGGASVGQGLYGVLRTAGLLVHFLLIRKQGISGPL